MPSYHTSRNEDTSAENGVCIPMWRCNEISDHTRRVECIPLSMYNCVFRVTQAVYLGNATTTTNYYYHHHHHHHHNIIIDMMMMMKIIFFFKKKN